VNLKRIALLSFALLTSFCLAETKVDYVLFNPDDLPKKQYAFTYKLEKNEQIIAGSSLIVNSKEVAFNEGIGSGERTKMNFYKCFNNNKDSKLYKKTVLINNYPTVECIAKENGDAKCVIKIYNAKDQDELAISEYNKKSCKEVEPLTYIQEFILNLKETEKNGVKDFDNGYKVQYAYSEFK